LQERKGHEISESEPLQVSACMYVQYFPLHEFLDVYHYASASMREREKGRKKERKERIYQSHRVQASVSLKIFAGVHSWLASDL
jgi:hypothetical protein